MKNKEIKFDKYSKKALVTMQMTNNNLYLTWKAWAGKSTTVNFFISKTKKKFVLLGTTGISAVNIWGQTIHSFFGITPKGKVKTMSNEKKEAIQNADVFIIDEVSMLRADLFDLLNKIMQFVMGNDEFLGGKQFIFVWDLYQLPPVVTNSELDEAFKEKYDWPFFFNGKTFDRSKFEVVELQKVHRQNEPEFINALNAIRTGYKWKDVLDVFNKQIVLPHEVNKKAIYLGTTNAIVDRINRERLDALPWEQYEFSAIVGWEYAKEDYPTERVIKLKIGARVMFTKNDALYSNGTLGEIVDIFKSKIKIKTDDDIMVELERFTWKNTDGEDEHGEDIVIGQFIQFPIKLGFATTIHKSQGKTFDNIVIDLWRWAFTEWQTYVGISRGTNLEGVQIITEVQPRDIKTSYKVKQFLNH